jgi:hypothetical protein
MTHRSHFRPRRQGVLAGLMLLSVTSSLGAAAIHWAPPAGADGSFSAVAGAEGLRVSVLAGGAPVSDVLADGGSPVVQSVLDSLGTSQAFASVAYPGDLLLSLPGLIAGVSNGRLTPPDYPLIVSSDATTTPKKEVVVPGLSMTAASEAARSQAASTIGGAGQTGPGLQGSASAVTEAAGDGTVTSRSESLVAGITTEALKIGTVRATATAVLSPGGTVRRTSSLEVSGLEVAGVKVGIGPDGLVFGDRRTPLPAVPGAKELFAQAGIELKLLGALDTPDGVVGQGLEISLTRPTGAAVNPVTVRLRFGRASAGVGRPGSPALTPPALPVDTAPGDTGAAPALSGNVQSPPPVAPLANTPAPAPASATVFSGPVLWSSPGAGPGPSAAVGLPASGAGATSAGSGEKALAPPSFRLRQAATAERFDTRGLYPVLAGIAVLTGVGVFLVGLFGVRMR